MTAMTEQEQAELLAAWLADPDAPVPEGLHHDVVEAVIALHPERAPAPRVSVDSILAGVRTGPLAADSEQPVPVYTTPKPANRPWAIVAMIAGSSGIIVAALALLSVGTLVATQTQESSPAREVSADGVAAAPATEAQLDTGLPAGAARPVATRPRPMPRSAPAPASQVAKAPQRVPELEGAAKVQPLEDAVASAEPIDAEVGDIDDSIGADGFGVGGLDQDLDANRQFRSGGGSAPRAPAAKGAAQADAGPPPPPASAPSPELAAAYESEEEARRQPFEERDRKQAEDAARRGAAEQAAAAAAAAERSLVDDDRAEADEAAEPQTVSLGRDASGSRESKKEKAKDAEDKARPPRSRASPAPPPSPMEAEPEKPAVIAELASLDPKTGTAGVVDADVTRARTALAAGNPIEAMNAIAVGLSRNPGNTRVRQLLLALQGDVHAAQGDTNAANRAWRQAAEIAARLQ